jgi:hypothetical protein
MALKMLTVKPIVAVRCRKSDASAKHVQRYRGAPSFVVE